MKSVIVSSRVLPLLASAVVFLQPARAMALDCDKAAAPDTKAICGAPELIELDDVMNEAYQRARKDPERAGSVKQDQIAWLKERNTCAADVSCLRTRMSDRIQELSDLLGCSNKTPSPQPPSSPVIRLGVTSKGAFVMGQWWVNDRCRPRIVKYPASPPTVIAAVLDVNGSLRGGGAEQEEKGCVNDESIELAYVSDGILTLHGTSYYNCEGMSHPRASEGHTSWNLKTGKRLALADLFGPGFGLKEAVALLVAADPGTAKKIDELRCDFLTEGVCNATDEDVVSVAVAKPGVLSLEFRCKSWPWVIQEACSGPWEVPTGRIARPLSESGKKLLK